MKRRVLLALDQGTTSSRAILFDESLRIVGSAHKELTQIYPQAGYMEHDAEEIVGSQREVMNRVLRESGVAASEIAAVGIANQRETTVVWDRRTGRPIHNAIVWQCRRTAPQCERMIADGCEQYIRENTGLRIDAYFSGTKIQWLLDHVPGARERAKRGDLLFGTVDTWLMWRLTGGRVHATDCTNASRTMLYNIRSMDWDDNILYELGIPRAMLPEVFPSSHRYGVTRIEGIDVPISAAAGDQQAALFGQGCFHPGDVKNTYGTGCFLLMNLGESFRTSGGGLLTTLSAGSRPGRPEYAMEGSVFAGGAVVQWLRDELGLIGNAAESEFFATQVPDSGGAVVVPAFTGLGAPYWDMYARGTIFGLTRGTSRSHLVRAALESIAFQSRDLVEAIAADTGVAVGALKVDGGASDNHFLMQFQADILDREVIRPAVRETTALGAAALAGLGEGIWAAPGEVEGLGRPEQRFVPAMDASCRDKLLSQWRRAVERTRGWAE